MLVCLLSGFIPDNVGDISLEILHVFSAMSRSQLHAAMWGLSPVFDLMLQLLKTCFRRRPEVALTLLS